MPSPSVQYRYDFNPRSSCEERHGLACQYPVYFDFNPRSSCEERHHSSIPAHSLSLISIHAPHARSDLGYGTLLYSSLQLLRHNKIT